MSLHNNHLGENNHSNPVATDKEKEQIVANTDNAIIQNNLENVKLEESKPNFFARLFSCCPGKGNKNKENKEEQKPLLGNPENPPNKKPGMQRSLKDILCKRPPH